MILCTNCGTKNQDNAQACEKCGRKLQSRWSTPPTGPNGQNGQNGKPAGSLIPEPVWQIIEPIMQAVVDEDAAKLVKSCAETWAYALMLIAGAFLTVFTEDWLFLAAGVVIAGALAWLRGI